MQLCGVAAVVAGVAAVAARVATVSSGVEAVAAREEVIAAEVAAGAAVVTAVACEVTADTARVALLFDVQRTAGDSLPAGDSRHVAPCCLEAAISRGQKINPALPRL